MATLDIKILWDLDEIVVFEMVGAMDTTTFTRMMEAAKPFLDKGVRRFVLEVSRLTYINSLGLAWLYKNAEDCNTAGGGIVLVKCPAKVKGVLDALGMTPEFKLAEGLETGLRHFKAALPKGPTVAPPAPAAAAPPATAPATAPAAPAVKVTPPTPPSAPPSGGEPPKA